MSLKCYSCSKPIVGTVDWLDGDEVNSWPVPMHPKCADAPWPLFDIGSGFYAEWKPFETAPKDGSLISVWVTRAAHTGKPDLFTDCSWADGCGDWGWSFSPDCLPTHWITQPGAPK